MRYPSVSRSVAVQVPLGGQTAVTVTHPEPLAAIVDGYSLNLGSLGEGSALVGSRVADSAGGRLPTARVASNFATVTVTGATIATSTTHKILPSRRPETMLPSTTPAASIPAAKTGDFPITFAKAVDTCWSASGGWHAGGVEPIVVAGIAVVSGGLVREVVDWPSLHAAISKPAIIEVASANVRATVRDTRADCPGAVLQQPESDRQT